MRLVVRTLLTAVLLLLITSAVLLAASGLVAGPWLLIEALAPSGPTWALVVGLAVPAALLGALLGGLAGTLPVAAVMWLLDVALAPPLTYVESRRAQA